MYTLLTPPASEPLSLSDVKTALRIDHDDDDTALAGMIATARTFLERRLDHAFLDQSWQARVEGTPVGPVPLRPGAVSAVTSVTITDEDGATTAMTSDDWRLCGTKPESIQFLTPLPSSTSHIDVVFSSGAADTDDIPADLLRALYLLTAHYYEERELFRERRYVPVPLGVEALIEAYKEVRL